jgi:tRNA-modifying protein YgfZ
MPSVSIPGRAVLSVSGADAQSFLQNIVTTDVDALEPGTLRAGALLSPQGKILFDFLVSRSEDGFGLECRADVAPDLLKRLTMYRLRAKVDFSLRDEASISARWGETAGSGGLVDTRFPQNTGVRRAAGEGGDRPFLWDALRVAHGVAESGADYALGDAFPHDVLLDANGGVGFRKGCFVGQEVVSRMQHRGTARRRVLIAESVMPLPAPGTEILAGGRAVGTLGTVAGAQAIALARIDRVAEAIAAGVPVVAGEASLTFSIPPGAPFGFPAPEATAAEP